MRQQAAIKLCVKAPDKSALQDWVHLVSQLSGRCLERQCLLDQDGGRGGRDNGLCRQRRTFYAGHTACREHQLPPLLSARVRAGKESRY
jgi:hypothetical protein